VRDAGSVLQLFDWLAAKKAETSYGSRDGEYAHMNTIHLITRVGQGLLAVAATGVTVLVLLV